MSNNLFWGVILFFVGLFTGVLIAWLYFRQRMQAQETRIHHLQTSINKKEQSMEKIQTRLREQDSGSPLKEVIPTTGSAEHKQDPKPDDLKRIEGIGPKISKLLNEAGITTFSQLAASSVSQLDQIVREAGISIADPGTWPEQANLAAAGDWEVLRDLQDRLKGGRRV